MLKTSVDNSFASNCIAKKEVDDHMAQTVLDVDDLEIVVDLCKLTYGNPQPRLMCSGKRLQLSLKNVSWLWDERTRPGSSGGQGHNQSGAHISALDHNM